MLIQIHKVLARSLIITVQRSKGQVNCSFLHQWRARVLFTPLPLRGHEAEAGSRVQVPLGLFRKTHHIIKKNRHSWWFPCHVHTGMTQFTNHSLLTLTNSFLYLNLKKMQQHRDSERQPVWQSGDLQARTCQVTISLARSQHGWIQFLYSTLICFPLFSWEKKKFCFMLPWCTVTHISTHSLQRKGA